MANAQIIDCAHFMPEREVTNAELPLQRNADKLVEESAFFRGVSVRRFASPTYTSGALGVAAAKKVLARNGITPASIDLVVTSCVLTDLLANGIGADVVRGIEARNANFLNVDTNCTSWISSVAVAKALLEAGMYKRILVITVTNFVSRLEDFNKASITRTLGDGASATLMVAGDRSSILGHYEACIGELYGHMRLEPEADAKGCYRNYWQKGPEPLTVTFSQELLDIVRKNATENLPRAVRTALDRAHLTTGDVNLLLTHQPNRIFIDGWRAALGIEPSRAFDTLDRYGNLFMSSIPVTFAEAIDLGRVKRGDIIAAGTFANAGDHLAALVWQW